MAGRVPFLSLCVFGALLWAACGDDDDAPPGQGGAAGVGLSGGGGGGGSGGGAACGDCRGFDCCDGTCVNAKNDIKNCGTCGTVCEGASPYCDQGTCGVPPCDPSTQCGPDGTCCATACCAPGRLCCTVPGPVGSTTECTPPTETGSCPAGCLDCRCASPGTPIATPEGERSIADLVVGDLVYTVDRGAIVVAPIARTTRTPVRGHRVVRVTLGTGAVLEISAGHPTADGRTFADLAAGDRLGGVALVEARSVAYEHSYTYDILPASETGAYFAGGVLIGSTLLRASPPR